MTYTPSLFSGELTLESIQRYLEQELLALSRDLRETQALELRPINAAPSRPRDGMIVYADGTNWDPGSGEGIYARENGAWVKL